MGLAPPRDAGLGRRKPVKASFCILGGIPSGFVFPFAGPNAAAKVAGTT